MKDELAKEGHYHNAMEAIFGKSNRDMLEMESSIIARKKEFAENKKVIAEKGEKLRNFVRELK